MTPFVLGIIFTITSVMPDAAELGSCWPDLKRLRALMLDELSYRGTGATTSSKAGVIGTTSFCCFFSVRSSRRFWIC